MTKDCKIVFFELHSRICLIAGFHSAFTCWLDYTITNTAVDHYCEAHSHQNDISNVKCARKCWKMLFFLQSSPVSYPKKFTPTPGDPEFRPPQVEPAPGDRYCHCSNCTVPHGSTSSVEIETTTAEIGNQEILAWETWV